MQVLSRNLAGSAGNGDRLPYRHALSRLHSDRRQMTVNTFYCTVLNSDIATQRAVLCYLDDLSWKDAVNSILVCCKVYPRSEEHTSELQSLLRISYAVFCLK